MIGKFTRRAGAIAAATVTAVALAGARTPEPAADHTPDGPQAAQADRLYPGLGDTRYDVTDYDISLRYRANDQPLDAVTRIDAWARTGLDRVHLDFGHGAVHAVAVNGRPARFRTDHEELLVTPAQRIPAGGRLRITVDHTSDPGGPPEEAGWVRTGDGLAMANQADAAHHVFPCNDITSDKARFTFRITAPENLTAVAGGLPSGPVREHAGERTWTYRTAHPMATELAQVSIGRSAVLRRTGPLGLPLRDVVGTGDRAELAARLAMTPGQVDWMEQQVGGFPFETYGLLSVDSSTGFELETQTLSLFERKVLLGPTALAAPLMVHELAHQWFGDSVTPATWSDLWLNEGHATWYEWRYRAEKNYGASLDAQAEAAYRRDNASRAFAGPPAAPLPPGPGKLGVFRENVYGGGALVLYALRQEIGDDAFRRLERAWVALHRDSNASTADFGALASQTAHRDLSGFLRPWLYGSTTPPMPGHPEWLRPAAGS